MVLAAHHDHRDLALERHDAFHQGRGMADRFEALGNFVRAADHDLAFAVIAEPPGLEQSRISHLRESTAQVLRIIHFDVGRDGNAEPRHEILFEQTILGHGKGVRSRQNRNRARSDFKRLGRDVLELAGHDRARCGKAGERVLVGIVSHRAGMGDVEGRRVGLVGIDVGLEPETRRSHRQQAAELTAAENADG
jgi:hypothetical protein